MSLIKTLKISWLSPNQVNKISCGEIINHKTINARTWKPELGGLFDPRIFGPFLNYECYCGKYKGKENKGQKCERCEVLVTEKNVQRWRSGHITLTSPVTNILLFKTLASQLSKLLEIPAKKLEDIIYFQAYVVLDNGLSNCLKKKDILEKRVDYQLISNILDEIIESKEVKSDVFSEAKELREKINPKEKNQDESIRTQPVFLEDYLEFMSRHQKVKISTGSEAFRVLLREIDLEKELEYAREKKQKPKIQFIQALLRNNIQLEWMVTQKLLVIPCGLRPATKLKGENTISTTQHNNFCRKLILISERVANYLNYNKEAKIFPEEIIHNEKIRLQKATDQFLESLLQSLSGKEGILRRYSLGKRVDYSARSVIVPNPRLLLGQIGLPLKIALVLYKPFLLQKILKKKIAFTIKEAEQLLLKNDPVVFTLLNEVIINHPLLINRAPSLHRLSIQGFYPQLTAGKSLELHPLVTTAFNADFDGDQMAVHLPLTPQTREEVRERILADKNISDPKNGYLIDIPSKDMILGIYYLTGEKKNSRLLFYDSWGIIWQNYERGKLSIHDLIVVPVVLVSRNLTIEKNKFLLTTLGKLIFNQILPPSFPYYLNDLSDYGKDQKGLIEINEIEEKWKDRFPLSGWKKKDIINFLNNLVQEVSREEMIVFLDKLKEIGFKYATVSGISISPFELEEIIDKNKEVELAHHKSQQIEEFWKQGFYGAEEVYQKKVANWTECKNNLEVQLVNKLTTKKDTSFYSIWDSGARASTENLTQLFVMRGLTNNYLGEIIETPITSSLWGGLTPNEFFISVYGAIKGITDTALKTAEAGYLTRRLVEASQNVIVKELDCQTKLGVWVGKEKGLSWSNKIYGRCLAQDVVTQSGETIFSQGTVLWKKEIETLTENDIGSLVVRSVTNCELLKGVCQKCYGADLSQKEEMVALGTAVGIIAAQSLGEPGTQLTMDTFHTGGIAGSEDIIRGLPKVKQIFDNIKPKKEEKAVLAQDAGKITIIDEKIIKQTNLQGQEIIYSYPDKKKVLVQIGEEITKGAKLTAGKVDLEEYLNVMGREFCQNYIQEEIHQVYHNQGIDINEKHIEIFSRQMLSRVEITDSGDSDYLVGDVADYQHVQKINQSFSTAKKKPIKFKNIISSLKDLASYPSSFLAGISFQNTLKSLVNYSLFQPVDYLQSPKESLMAGQLIPVGTGFREREKYQFKQK
jgi:DNA-directed RNA polymerase subunit beta'